MTSARPIGLLVDYGGVLTTDVFASFDAFCTAEGLAPGRVLDVLKANRERLAPLIIGLETGALPEAEFEVGFAEALGVAPEGLIVRLFAGMAPEPRMLRAVGTLHEHGIRTGLLSNSWGVDSYPRQELALLFDSLVISGEVGLRKPDPRIYRLAAESIGVPPEQCAFIDDAAVNASAADELGMTGIQHVAVDTSIAELERLFGVSLAGVSRTGHGRTQEVNESA